MELVTFGRRKLCRFLVDSGLVSEVMCNFRDQSAFIVNYSDVCVGFIGFLCSGVLKLP